MLKRVLLAMILVAGPAVAQQQPAPEIQAASQMLQQAQAQEFALRVEVAKLRADNDRLKAAQPKPDAPSKP